MAASYNFLSSTDSSAGQVGPMPHIAEETLVYTVHLPPLSPGASSAKSVALSEISSEACAALINDEVQRLLNGGLREGQSTWIWHKDAWELRVASMSAAGAPGSSSDTRRTLEGRMRVGDSVDDEWLVVWLLREVSKKWPELIISIRDTDGDFLLIEAANSLPKWVTPTNSENRLWLRGAHLYLLPLTLQSPLSSRPASTPDYDVDDISVPSNSYLSITDALSHLRSTSSSAYRAPDALERDVWARIRRYPEAMKTHTQKAAAYLPKEVVRCLRARPDLVQRAVEGFYTRDPAQLRLASRVTHFSPKAENTVLSAVQLTRTAFAQLRGQVFHPPKAFGPEWRVSESPAEHNDSQKETERRRRDLGIKLTIGFEIMYREDAKRSRRQGSQGDPSGDPDYAKYLENLKRAGWFGGDIEGSEGWKAKETKAKEGWRSVKSSETETRESFAELVDEILALAPKDDTSESPDLQEDSDSWLVVDPDELDGMLQAASGGIPRTTSTDGAEHGELGDEHVKVLSDLAGKINSFVEGKGDLEGARFEDELSEDEDMADPDSDDESMDEDQGMDTEMDESERDRRLQGLVPALDPKDWGRRTETIADKGKQVVFAEPERQGKMTVEEELPNVRPPKFTPEEFDGHVVDSDDDEESDDDQGPPGGYGAQSTATVSAGGNQTQSELEASIKALADEFTKDVARPRDVKMDKSKAKDKSMAMDIDEVEEPEPDMGEEEEEFLKFAREALGINEEMWTGMLDERKARGAYVPSARSPLSTSGNTNVPMSFDEHRKATAEKETKGKSPAIEPSPTSSHQHRNPDLDSFDKVMEAMDRELSSKTQTKPPKFTPKSARTTASVPSKPTPSKASSSITKGKGALPPLSSLPSEADIDDMDEDDLAAMDRELRAALKGAGVDDLDEDDEMDDEMRNALEGGGNEAREEYKMMKDFLESYRSQAGQSGVVGNLFGRLGGQ